MERRYEDVLATDFGTLPSPQICIGQLSSTDRHTQDGPQTFTLTDKDDPDRRSIVRLEARYAPVPVTLEARESVNSM